MISPKSESEREIFETMKRSMQEIYAEVQTKARLEKIWADGLFWQCYRKRSRVRFKRIETGTVLAYMN